MNLKSSKSQSYACLLGILNIVSSELLAFALYFRRNLKIAKMQEALGMRLEVMRTKWSNQVSIKYRLIPGLS